MGRIPQSYENRPPLGLSGRSFGSIHTLRVRSLLLALFCLAGAAQGQSGRGPSAAGGDIQSSSLQSATNGSVIIPVRDASGQLRETMVLVPAQAPARRRPNPEPAGGRESVPRPFPAANGTNAADRTAMSTQQVLEAQVALVRRGISPGSIDGLMGSQTRAALRAFQQRENLPLTGVLDDITRQRLQVEAPLYTNYVIAATDLERLLPLSGTWLGKSQQPRLDYETILELVAERTFTHPNLLRRLNPSIPWTNVVEGSEVTVLSVGYPEPGEKAAFLQIRLGERSLKAFGVDTNVLAHFPCSIAQRVEKRPLGERLEIVTVAPSPNYTFDPAVFPESAEARQIGRKLILQPGPNNPVGAVWIGLNKPGYGIHGTPRPEDVGRTESHGCFRLANWNAEHLLKLVVIGTPVYVEP